jgi:hypothetical protein
MLALALVDHSAALGVSATVGLAAERWLGKDLRRASAGLLTILALAIWFLN